MKRPSPLWEVARWEFLRFLKPRDLAITLILFVLGGAGFSYVTHELLGGDEQEHEAATLAVLGPSAEAWTWPDDPRFTFVAQSEEQALPALDEGLVDGVLVAGEDEVLVLLAKKPPRWRADLQAALTAARLPARLAAAGIDAQTWEHLAQPVELAFVAHGEVRAGTADVWILLGLMVVAIFIGCAVLFTAITGEKTLRVTELVVSAVSPQTWIDGKILGVSGYVLVHTLVTALGIILAAFTSGWLHGGLPDLPPLLTNPALFLTTLLFALFGFAWWFTFFAAVTATIQDPNTSSRSALILLPGMALGAGCLGLLGDAQGSLFTLLSYLPPTSPSAMPLRLLLGHADWFEALLALLLLAATLPLLRRLAGKVFALGILMTGKEPSMREILRWLRRT